MILIFEIKSNNLVNRLRGQSGRGVGFLNFSAEMDDQVGQRGVSVSLALLTARLAPPAHLQAGHPAPPLRLPPLQLVGDLLYAGRLVRLVRNQVTDFA